MHKRKMIRLEPDPKVIEFLKRTRREMEARPAWEQQLLDACSRSTHKVPRPIGLRLDGPGEAEPTANS